MRMLFVLSILIALSIVGAVPRGGGGGGRGGGGGGRGGGGRGGGRGVGRGGRGGSRGGYFGSGSRRSYDYDYYWRDGGWINSFFLSSFNSSDSGDLLVGLCQGQCQACQGRCQDPQ